MIYFNCTSVFHSFIISYIMLKEFPESKQKACLIIPEHVRNLVNLVSDLKTLPFIANVIVIEESCVDIQKASALTDISFQNGDIIFVGGMERIGMWLIRKGYEHHLKVILFEEGANIITDMNEYMEHAETLGSIKKGELLQEHIHEIWKLNGMIWMPDQKKDIKIHDLEMKKYLQNPEFMQKLSACMDRLFVQQKKEMPAPVVFFDTYMLSAGKHCSRRIEKMILHKVVQTISEWDYEIKPHPNDSAEWKYENGFSMAPHTNVPIEILRLRQTEPDRQEAIYISYGYTGCIANELLLLDGFAYVIFLYKILRMYGIEYPGEVLVKNLYEQCSDIQKKKIFVPDTFTEMKMVLYQITGKEPVNKEESLKEGLRELTDTGRDVRMIYRHMFANLADELNETSLLCMDGCHEWKVIASKKILVNERKYEIAFDLSNICGLKDAEVFRWYIARGVIVKVKLQRIVCLDRKTEAVFEFGEKDLTWPDAQKDENGWYVFHNCDPIVEFRALQKDGKPFQKIVIESEMEWDLSYEAMLLLRNKNLEHMTQIQERLIRQNEDGEKEIRQLNGYLKDWEKEVHNRDKEIKMTIAQRDELNTILIKERKQWQAAMERKEKQIRELELDYAAVLKKTGNKRRGRYRRET